MRAGYRESAARYVLGEMALERMKFQEAVEHLSKAVLLDPRDLKARTVLAMAERLAGKLDDAQKHIDAVVQELPIDYLALSEQYLINKARGRDVEAARAHQELWRLLDREPDSVLELAFDYRDEGRIGETIDVLEQAVENGSKYPMLHYTLGYFCGMRKNDPRAATELRSSGPREIRLMCSRTG